MWEIPHSLAQVSTQYKVGIAPVVFYIAMGVLILCVVITLVMARRGQIKPFATNVLLALFAFAIAGTFVLSTFPLVDVVTKLSSGGDESSGD